jgi:ATP-dependent protease ClpP protease subunit
MANTDSRVCELAICGFVTPRAFDARKVYASADGLSTFLGSEAVAAPDAIAAIDAAHARGARVLFVKIDTRGGNAQAGFAIFDRLRRFSREGGIVLTFVSGMAGSVGSVIAAAGDFVIMAPGSKIVLHSARTGDGRSPEALNRHLVRLLASRTSMTRPQLEAAHADVDLRSEVHAEDAPALGWADWIRGEADARVAAAELAAGKRVTTRRSRMLLARREIPAVLPDAPAEAVAMISDTKLGLVNCVARVTRVVERADDLTIEVEAEEWPYGVASAAAYEVQSSDGARLFDPSAHTAVTLLYGQAGELWPNGTSEIDVTADVSFDEAAYMGRYEAGAGAYAGTWVRRIVNDQAGAATESIINGPIVSAVPGHTYEVTAQVKLVSGTGDAHLELVALASDGSTSVATASSALVTSAGTWTRVAATLIMPANAVYVVPWLVATKTGAGGSLTAYFDAISFIRLGTAPVSLTATNDRTQVTGYCGRSGVGTCTATTGAVVCTGGGGVPPYSYAWEYVSGTTATINAAAAASTTFSRTAGATLGGGQVLNGLYRCKVTDHDGSTAYSANVDVQTTHERTD